jgi:hypothetical protein
LGDRVLHCGDVDRCIRRCEGQGRDRGERHRTNQREAGRSSIRERTTRQCPTRRVAALIAINRRVPVLD